MKQTHWIRAPDQSNHGAISKIRKRFDLFLRGLGLVLLLGVLSLFVYLFFLFKPEPAPSDQSMIENFERNRATFDALREKICSHDSHQTVMIDPSWSRPVVSDALRDEYAFELRKIGARGIQSLKPDDGSCTGSIEYWSVGFAGDGDYKKYEFGPPWKNQVIVDSLDQLPLGNNDIVFFRRELTDGWALAFDHWP